MLFLPGNSELSLTIWDDTCNFSYERFITEIVPQNHFNTEETHIHNTFNFCNPPIHGGSVGHGGFGGHGGSGGHGRHGGNVRSGNVHGGLKNCGDVVDVHVNNLKQCVRDHIESQRKKGYQPKGIYPQGNGNYKVVTKKGKQKFTRIFVVDYF